mmetsp:Transcript_20492/g.48076  ORF Transcript_20492/g.48076 Transcript_20492/m.48076 type:complete len:220 (-) Transcript_20492:337-996(-)
MVFGCALFASFVALSFWFVLSLFLFDLFWLHSYDPFDTWQTHGKTSSPYLLQRVFQKGVFESEVLFDARAPTRLPVKIHVGPLLVFVRCDLGFLVPLEPGHILFVKPPGLLLKFPRRQILLVGPLFVIKNVKQGVRSQFLENGRVFKQRVRGRRVGGRCTGIGVLRGVRVGSGGRPVVFVGGWERRIGLVQDASVGGCVVPVVASREGTIGATAGSPSV